MHPSGGRPVGKGGGGDQVAAAHLGRIQPQPPGDGVHHPLHGVGGGVLPVAPIGADGHLIGIYAVNRPLQICHGVSPRRPRRGQGFRHGMSAAETVGAQVGIEPHPHRQQRAVIAIGGVEVLDFAPPVDGGSKLLLPVGNPLHRAVKADGQRGGDDGFGIGVDLGAETAAHIAGKHPHPAFGEAQDVGHRAALHVRRLGRQPQGKLAHAAVVGGGHRPRLQGVGRQPRLGQPQRYHAGGGGKGPVRVAHAAGSPDAEVGA